MVAGIGSDQLRRHPHPAAGFAHASFEDIAYAQLFSDLLYVDRLAFVGKGRVTGNHREGAPAGEKRNNVLGYAIGKVFLLRVVAEIRKRQDRDSAPVVELERARNGCGWVGSLGFLPAHLVYTNGSRDVFESLRAEVDKIEIYLACDLIADVFGDVDAAWLSQGLEPRRDVDAIAKNIARLDDDIAQIDS